MKMPGFAAEISLRSRPTGYWTSHAGPAHSAVLPAAPLASACGHICDLADRCNRSDPQSSLCQAYNYICHGVCEHAGGDVACLVNCLQSGGKLQQCSNYCGVRFS